MATTKKPKAYKHVDLVEVYVWNQLVGAVALDPAYGYYAFAFDARFRRSGIDLSPLKMSITAPDEVWLFTDLPEITYKRLPAMLADSLPDDFGNALINRYMADNGIAADQVTALDRLAYMGKRSMGALEFKPQTGPGNKKPFAIDLGKLVQEARNAVHGILDCDEQTSAALRSTIDVGTSAGGARAKAVIAWNPDSKEIRSGHADVEAGFSHWLLKFDGMDVDRSLNTGKHFGRIEYAYYLMAIDAGITMSESQLLAENGRAHFMTKRFDRADDNSKHHLQTLCAMAHVDYKKKASNSYSQLYMTIKALNLPRSAMVEAFRRMVFNVMAKNCDDHSKNFSFLLKQGQPWALAPAYDITHSYDPNSEWVAQHLMSVNGKFADFTVDDLYADADRFGIGEIKSLIRTTADVLSRWEDYARKAGITSTDEIERIRKDFWLPQV
ncbi:serine/threonine-protein kinase HipA [Oxalobacteraceae bacterium GrIS 2.11]